MAASFKKMVISLYQDNSATLQLLVKPMYSKKRYLNLNLILKKWRLFI